MGVAAQRANWKMKEQFHNMTRINHHRSQCFMAINTHIERRQRSKMMGDPGVLGTQSGIVGEPGVLSEQDRVM